MKNFRTFNLAVQFYKQVRCQNFTSALQSQLERAAHSIALNLAEGQGRYKVADQTRFFHIAMGSLRECQAALILAESEDSEAWETLDSLAAHLYKLIKANT